MNSSKLLGEVSSAGTVTAAYTWGAEGLVSEHLSPTSGSPQSLWYLFGPQGETRSLTNSTGQVVDTYNYTAYGKSTSSSAGDANPFQYGGKFGYYSEYNGAVLCGHRWYDSLISLRWLSRDPIGYDGGDNLYAYCNDNPGNRTDAEGTSSIWDDINTAIGKLIGTGGRNRYDPVNKVTVNTGSPAMDILVWGQGLITGNEYYPITLGHVILEPTGFDVTDPLNTNIYNHELGHVDQSDAFGPLYLYMYGSGLDSALNNGLDPHDGNPLERDADKRSGNYNPYSNLPNCPMFDKLPTHKKHRHHKLQ